EPAGTRCNPVPGERRRRSSRDGQCDLPWSFSFTQKVEWAVPTDASRIGLAEMAHLAWLRRRTPCLLLHFRRQRHSPGNLDQRRHIQFVGPNSLLQPKRLQSFVELSFTEILPIHPRQNASQKLPALLKQSPDEVLKECLFTFLNPRLRKGHKLD